MDSYPLTDSKGSLQLKHGICWSQGRSKIHPFEGK